MRRALGRMVAALFFSVAFSCGEPNGQVGTNTNWMKRCDSNAVCGDELSCACGRCTLPCSSSDVCPEGAACSPRDSALLQCAGTETLSCQPTCARDDDCGEDRLCHRGVCADVLPQADCPEGSLFCEDFEEEVQFDEVVTEGNTLTLQQTATPSGSRALQASVSEGPSVAYLRGPLVPQSSGELFVSAWVKVPQQAAHDVAPLALWAAAEESWALRLVIKDARLELWAETTPLTSAFDLQAGQWHCLQMDVTVADGSAGTVVVSVDGIPVGTAQEVDTLPEGGIDAVTMGTLWAGTTADVWVDRVIVQSTPISCFD